MLNLEIPDSGFDISSHLRDGRISRANFVSLAHFTRLSHGGGKILSIGDQEKLQ